LFLRVINTSPIATFGTCCLSLDIGLRCVFPSVFVVADVPFAILIADFLVPLIISSTALSPVYTTRPQISPSMELPFTTGNSTILCDVSTPSHCPCVPPSLHRKVFFSLNNLSHFESLEVDKLVSNRFAWPEVHNDLKACARACLVCQRSKVQRQNNVCIDTLPVLVQGSATFTWTS
uniref:Integrase_H2C2 domain-containing protein n=1 Tax=Schistocephalus solidus TaxID=70667 RepID=A0A183TMP8_SCHSO